MHVKLKCISRKSDFQKWVSCEVLASIQDNGHNEPLSYMGAKA